MPRPSDPEAPVSTDGTIGVDSLCSYRLEGLPVVRSADHAPLVVDLAASRLVGLNRIGLRAIPDEGGPARWTAGSANSEAQRTILSFGYVEISESAHHLLAITAPGLTYRRPWEPSSGTEPRPARNAVPPSPRRQNSRVARRSRRPPIPPPRSPGMAYETRNFLATPQFAFGIRNPSANDFDKSPAFPTLRATSPRGMAQMPLRDARSISRLTPGVA